MTGDPARHVARTAAPLPFFSTSTHVAGGAVGLRGDLDCTTASLLDDAGRSVLAGGASGVRISMAGVTFLNSGGLNALVRLANDARARGRGFAVCEVPERLRRLFEIGGLGWMLADDAPGGGAAAGIARARRARHRVSLAGRPAARTGAPAPRSAPREGPHA